MYALTRVVPRVISAREVTSLDLFLRLWWHMVLYWGSRADHQKVMVPHCNVWVEKAECQKVMVAHGNVGVRRADHQQDMVVHANVGGVREEYQQSYGGT